MAYDNLTSFCKFCGNSHLSWNFLLTKGTSIWPISCPWLVEFIHYHPSHDVRSFIWTQLFLKGSAKKFCLSQIKLGRGGVQLRECKRPTYPPHLPVIWNAAFWEGWMGVSSWMSAVAGKSSVILVFHQFVWSLKLHMFLACICFYMLLLCFIHDWLLVIHVSHVVSPARPS